MNILLTGCSRGIGFSIASKLVSEGHSVTGLIRTETEEITQLEKEFSNLNLVKIDLSSQQSVQEICDSKIEKMDFDVLINNAGLSQRKPFLDLSISDWNTIFQVNLLSTIQLTKAVLPKMIEKKNGVIINMSSVGGQWGGVHQVHYAATKAAIINFTKSLAKSYAKNGIVPFVISPGSIDTEMITPELPTNDKELNQFLNTIPVNRLGRPDEIAELVSFLINKTPRFMVGHTFNINGGVYFG